MCFGVRVHLCVRANMNGYEIVSVCVCESGIGGRESERTGAWIHGYANFRGKQVFAGLMQLTYIPHLSQT